MDFGLDPDVLDAEDTVTLLVGAEKTNLGTIVEASDNIEKVF